MNRAALARSITARLDLDTKGFSKGTNDAKRSLRDFKKDMGSAEAATGKFGIAAKAAGVGIGIAAVAVVAAGAMIVTSTIKSFAKFDAKMTQSTAIMGDLSDSMRKDLSDTARQVAKDTNQAASEVAEGYFFLASAGLDAAQSMKALPQVAKFAKAGMFDLATATDLATDAQSALGLTVADESKNLENLTRVTDVLVKANTLANATVQQFSEALTNKAAAALRILNKDMEEGVAVLAVYADQGLKGAAAGEALNIVMRDLQRSALDNKEEWSGLGISVFDASGNMRHIADIIEDVTEATDGMSDAQRKQTLSDLGFQERSVQQIIALLGQADAIRKYEAALRSAGGATEDVAGRQMETLEEQFKSLGIVIEDVKIQLGEELAPTFEEALPDIESLIETLGALAIALGPSLVTGAEMGIRAIEGLAESGFRYQAAALAWASVTPWRFAIDDLEEMKLKAESMARAMELVSMARRGLIPGVDTVTQLKNAWADLARDGFLSVDTMNLLSTAMGATETETLAAAVAMRDYILATGLAPDQLPDVIDVIDKLSPSMGELTTRTRGARGAMDEIPGSADDAGGAIDGMGGDAEGAAEKVQTLADALHAAEEGQRGLLDAVKEFSDPVFASIQAQKRLAEAEAKVLEVQGDAEATTEDLQLAQLDLAEAALEAQIAMDNVNEDNMAAALAVIQAELGISEQAARDLLGVYQELDGQNVTVTIKENMIRNIIAGTSGDEVHIPGTSGSRAHGGDVRANQVYQVGEGNKPELLMIPGDGGRVFSNQEARQMASSTTSGDFNVYFKSVSPKVDEQNAAAMASVKRRMETR